MQLLTFAATAALFASQAAAKPTFVALIPGSTNVKGVEAIGHVDPNGGGARNAFGEAFEEAKTTWTVDLCYSDSDSDGQFNGAELGDPCCEWVKGTNEKLAYTTATAPGDKASKQDPTIWASVKCADGSSPEAKYKAYTAKASGGATAPAPAGNSSETTPSATTVAPVKTTAAPAATPAPTTKSGAAQVAAAASAVTVAVVAAFM